MEQPGDLLGEMDDGASEQELAALRRVQRALRASNVPLPGVEQREMDATAQFMDPFDNPQAPRSSLFGKE